MLDFSENQPSVQISMCTHMHVVLYYVRDMYEKRGRDTERERGDGGVHTLDGGVGDVAHDAGDGRGRGRRRTTEDGIGQRKKRKKKRTRNAKPRSRKEARKRSEKRHKKGKKYAEEFLGQKSPPVGGGVWYSRGYTGNIVVYAMGCIRTIVSIYAGN